MTLASVPGFPATFHPRSSARRPWRMDQQSKWSWEVCSPGLLEDFGPHRAFCKAKLITKQPVLQASNLRIILFHHWPICVCRFIHPQQPSTLSPRSAFRASSAKNPCFLAGRTALQPERGAVALLRVGSPARFRRRNSGSTGSPLKRPMYIHIYIYMYIGQTKVGLVDVEHD